jgi:hypothetical protein
MTRNIRGLVFAVIVISLCHFCKEAYATTYTAASCNESDVQAAIARATHDGDVVSIPAGTCTWTSTLSVTIPNSLTIQGAGAISAVGGGSTNTVGTDQTIIQDNYPHTGNDRATWQITTDSLQLGKTFRITGIAFTSITGTNSSEGAFRMAGYSTGVRIDHCHFFGPFGHALKVGGAVYGVADHNVWDFSATQVQNMIYIITGANWNNDSVGEGDKSWADSPYWGSNQFFFVEDSLFNEPNMTGQGYINDCDHGGREVFRYNAATGYVVIQGHEILGDRRGCRASEIYNNNWAIPASYASASGFGTRSGTMLVWGNTIATKHIVSLVVDRLQQFSQGTFPYWEECGQAFSGTVNVASNGVTVTWVSGTYQFLTRWPSAASPSIVINGVSYPIASVTAGGSGPSGTGVTMTLRAPGTGGALTGASFYVPSKWDQNSDTTGYACIDQPGRGKGDLITGVCPNKVNSVTRTVTWPNQQLEPVYVWANHWTQPSDPTSSVAGAGGPNAQVIHENRDYYQQFGPGGAAGSNCTGTPCNITVGVNQTSRAPVNGTDSCTAGPGGNTPGVGWWNTTNQTLYVCTATNTWTAYYTPYTYPHPLTQSSTSSINPPTDLAAQAH